MLKLTTTGLPRWGWKSIACWAIHSKPTLRWTLLWHTLTMFQVVLGLKQAWLAKLWVPDWHHFPITFQSFCYILVAMYTIPGLQLSIAISIATQVLTFQVLESSFVNLYPLAATQPFNLHHPPGCRRGRKTLGRGQWVSIRVWRGTDGRSTALLVLRPGEYGIGKTSEHVNSNNHPLSVCMCLRP